MKISVKLFLHFISIKIFYCHFDFFYDFFFFFTVYILILSALISNFWETYIENPI